YILYLFLCFFLFFVFQAEDGIRDPLVTGVQTCALPISLTIDFGGVTQGGCGWVVDQFTNVDTTGTNGSGAIVQSAKSTEPDAARSEERRVEEVCRYRWEGEHYKQEVTTD